MELTALEIAKALGVSKQAVVKQIAAVAPTRPAAGNVGAAWSLESLPSSLREKLEKLPSAARAGFRTCEARIASLPPLYKGDVPFSDLPHEQREVALYKALALAPFLKRLESGEPIAQLSRSARESFARHPLFPDVPSAETVERWMRDARERDGGRMEFSHPALYQLSQIEGKQRGVAAATRASLELLIDEIGSDLDSPALWEVALRNVQTLGEVAERNYLRALSEVLQARTGKSANAIKKKRLAMWKKLEAGEPIDRRKVGTGRVRNFQLSQEEQNRLRRLHLEKESFPLAVEWFARDAACTPATKALIHQYLDEAAAERKLVRWPISLRRAAHVTEEAKRLFRGEKAYDGIATSDRRGLFWIDPDGIERPFLSNDIWESDDMSSNQPFRWIDPETGEMRLGRQTLCTLDVFACRWLGVSPVGRERDAYRAEDIADHLRECVATHGLPKVWRLERGSWESAVIEGIEIEVNGEKRVWGGLNPLCEIVHTWTSRAKGTIESSFNLLQAILAHRSTDIGRYRGEFEAAKKLVASAQRGDEKAWNQFWRIEQCADAFELAMGEFNGRPKQRRAHGRAPVVPDDLYARAEKRAVPAGEWWRFSPVKRAATVRKGIVEVAVKHYPVSFRFRVNNINDGVYLENGHRVLIAFHPGRPEEGCFIFNYEGHGSARNREGVPIGELLLTAPMAEDAPQLNLSRDELAFTARRNANAAVRTEFRAIVPHGTRRVATSTARDQYGQSAEVRTNPRIVDTDVPLPGKRHPQNRTAGNDLIAAARNLKKPTAADTEEDDLAVIERLERAYREAARERGEIFAEEDDLAAIERLERFEREEAKKRGEAWAW